MCFDPTPSPRSTRRVAARRALLAGLLFFVLGQGLTALALDRWYPELRDPEYGHRLLRLRALQAEHPGRPLALLLGSSRTEIGFSPAFLPAWSTDAGPEPLAFNFGLSGAGPLQEILYLRRLLEAGVRPQHLFVELHPALLADEGEEQRMAVQRLCFSDLSCLRRLAAGANVLERRWLEAALTPVHTHRFCLLSRFVPSWLPWWSRQDHLWDGLDRHGWLPCLLTKIEPEQRRLKTEATRCEYAHWFAKFRLAAASDRALRELLDTCRAEGIPVTFYVMPEGTAFRGWYPPGGEAWLAEYFERLRAEYGVATVDARDWVPDDQFMDAHHLTRTGAVTFSERFGREVLTPTMRRAHGAK